MSLPEQGDAPAPPPSTRAGIIAGYVASALAPGSQNAYLSALVVDRKYRRKGIATRLMVAAQRWAATQGAVELMADIPARNYPALRLLQKAGFAFCGFNDRCYPDNEVVLFFSCRLR
jgi:ribosomal protein S18 acetylase RimI-like enzyme